MTDLNQYKQVSYWDERFTNEQTYEWLANWEQFAHLILPFLNPKHRILHIGCGNSNVSSTLYELGFHNITNIDFSKTLIQRSHQMYPHMKWICDDIRTLSQLSSDQKFDIVFEKASIEALIADEKSQWNYSEYAKENLKSVFDTIYRVLVDGGIFFSISFTQPRFRVPFLMKDRKWSCIVQEFGDNFRYFCYRLTKGDSPNLSDLQFYMNDYEVNIPQLVDMPEFGLDAFKNAFDENGENGSCTVKHNHC